MIFKAKWNWKTKKEVIDQLEHCIGLIQQGYPEGYGWSLAGKEEVSPVKEIEEEPLPELE